MRLFVRAAGWGRGYYWTEVAADGPRDAGQVPVDHYFDLLRNQDSLAPSLSLYHSAAGYHLLCLGLPSRRNDPSRRVIGNSLLLETPDERLARRFIAGVLAADAGTVFGPHFAADVDDCIHHDETREHYRVEATELRRRLAALVDTITEPAEADPFPDDVFVERLFARNSAERRGELRGALCRYELPPAPPNATPRLLLAVVGLEDAERLCDAGAWIALSERCEVEGWAVFTPPGQTPRPRTWESC